MRTLAVGEFYISRDRIEIGIERGEGELSLHGEDPDIVREIGILFDSFSGTVDLLPPQVRANFEQVRGFAKQQRLQEAATS